MAQDIPCNSLHTQSCLPPTSNQIVITSTTDAVSMADIYGFDDNDTIPEFLWRTNIDCLSKMSQAGSGWAEPRLPISPTVYQRMEPAFRRVGAMLVMSENFFTKILFARVQSAGPFGAQSALDPDYTPSRKDLAKFYRVLQNLHKTVRIFAGPDEAVTVLKCHGQTTGRVDNAAKKCTLSIELDSKYLAFFSDPDYRSIKTGTKKNVLFSLATTIAHEMAHAFWQIRGAKESRANYKQCLAEREIIPWKMPPEPLYDASHPEAELGRAWEIFMFGGIPEMRGQMQDHHAVDCAHGTQLYGWLASKASGEERFGLMRPYDDMVRTFFNNKHFKRMWNLVLEWDRSQPDDSPPVSLETLTEWLRLRSFGRLRWCNGTPSSAATSNTCSTSPTTCW